MSSPPEPGTGYDPIAIVGFSLKFPGDSNSTEGFWDTIINGRCASSEFPEDRLSLSGLYHPDSSRHNSINLRGGHFIREDVTAFDAPFFSISAAEAASMDPQQRILLETTYRALENAGIPIQKVANTRTSVFTGSFTDDFKSLYTKDVNDAASHAATGITTTLNANRISWFFNLRGNSVAIDTACSSSLVALDFGCRSLHIGESTTSIVTGVNLLLAADLFYMLSDMNMLSPDSRCWSFDERGNGYGRGEGVGVLILKKVSDAIRDGDVIRAVIRSTGSNSDGYTPGITQPNPVAQEALIRDCYRKAGLHMHRTGYFEAHGTGTPAGDPVEANALGAAFRRERDQDRPLYIGAVKANIGHLEGTSGIAGIIKTILVLEKGIIPPIATLDRLNPRIDEDFLRLKFPRTAIPWPYPGLRRASINSFGFGGSNSHAILDDALHFLQEHNLNGIHNTISSAPVDVHGGLTHVPLRARPSSSTSDLLPASSSHKVILVSAADKEGVSRITAQLSEHLSRVRPNLSSQAWSQYIESLIYTQATRRTALAWKSSAIIDLNNLDLTDLSIAFTTPVRTLTRPKIAFIFTGQGAQWAAMGKELMIYPEFRASIDDSERTLLSLGCSWKLREELLNPSDTQRINDPALSQPLCTALQIALVKVLQACGVHAQAVVGHSSGEIAAAYCSGAFSESAAIKIAYMRGLCTSELRERSSSKGAMMALGLSVAKAAEYLRDEKTPLGDLVIACQNGPKNVTISGPEEAIDLLKPILDRKKIFARKLVVDVAYHSPQMRAIAKRYAECLADVDFGLAETKAIMMSSVTGNKVESDILRSPSYWVENLVSPVLFHSAFEHIGSKRVTKKLDMSHLNTCRVDACIEIGPHSALRGQVRDILVENSQESAIQYTSALERGKSGAVTFLTAMGQLDCHGFDIDWIKVNHPDTMRDQLIPLCDLPEYPFDHSKSYWHESKFAKGSRLRSDPPTDLLGKRPPDWNHHEARWQHFLRLSELPWIEDHKINGITLFPAAGMIVMAVEALKKCSTERAIRGFELRDISFHTALAVPNNTRGVQVELHLSQDHDQRGRDGGWSKFRLLALEQDEWIECCHGSARVDITPKSSEMNDGSEDMQLLKHYQTKHQALLSFQILEADTTQLYKHLDECGFAFGPSFRSIKSASFSAHTAAGSIATHRWQPGTEMNPRQDHMMHPCTLDGLIQLPMVPLTQGGTEGNKTLVPTSIRRLWIAASGLDWPTADKLDALATVTCKDHRGVESDHSALTADGSKLGVVLEGLRLTYVSSGAIDDEEREKHTLWEFAWKPDVDLATPSSLNQLCVRGEKAEEPAAFYEKLAFLLYVYLVRALEQFEDNDHIEAEHLGKYLSWARRQIQEYSSKQAPTTSETFHIMASNETYVTATFDVIQDANAQGKAYTNVGTYLPAILSGKMSALDILFNGSLMDDHYASLSLENNAFRSLDRFLHLYSHKYPGARYLEVGAGTGGSTLPILRSLTHGKDPKTAPALYGSYTFTDVSESFFEAAREKFKDFPDMVYGRLDVEQAPDVQGYEPESFDVIVAANVVHATASLANTLSNLRGLLRPGGKLVLYEIVRPEILRNGFIFGLLPGWWLSEEDYRNKGCGPCLETGKWDEVLRENGFSGVDLEMKDFENKGCHELSILVATKVEETLSNAQVKINLVDLQMISGIEVERLRSALVHAGVDPANVYGSPCLADGAKGGGDMCVVLDDLKEPVLSMVGDDELDSLKSIMTSYRTIVWITRHTESGKHPNTALVDGFARTMRNEYEGLKFVTISLSASFLLDSERSSQIAQITLNSLLSNPDDCESAYEDRDGLLHICRLTESASATDDVQALTQDTVQSLVRWDSGAALRMTIGTPGLLDSLHFIEDHMHATPLEHDEVEIRVRAIGMNFKDCLIALGQVNGAGLGNECSGVVTRVGRSVSTIAPGQRVCMSAVETFKTFARSKVQCVCRLPDQISFVEAAAIPTQFCTAWACLIDIARLERGETVLIHAGAGGTGQAAIQIAQHVGAEIFTSVGSMAKKELLMAQYSIPAEHIFYSRDASFAKGVMRVTGGRGVDVVLNSLAGEGLVRSWQCLAPYGRFVEIGKRDILDNAGLPMYQFNRGVSFSAFDGSIWMTERPHKAQKCIETIMGMFAEGIFRTATPLHVHSIAEVGNVFRLLADGKSSGKVVLECQQDAEVPATLTRLPTYELEANGTYVIAGGLGGVGRTIATWMVSRGARSLILLSRSGPTTEVARGLIRSLEEQGAVVKAPRCDISNKVELVAALDECLVNMPTVKGCVQASMVLRDGLFEDMTAAQWNAAIQPKVAGSWNLHEVLPTSLDFFILLSSVSGVCGQRGQSNYAAGNTFLDALAHYRVAQGQAAVSLDLGAISSDGYLADNQDVMARLLNSGAMRAITRKDLLALLERHCNPMNSRPDPCQLVVGVNTPCLATDPPAWMAQRTYSVMHATRGGQGPNDAVTSTRDFRAEFMAASTAAEASIIAARALVTKLARSLSTLEDEDSVELGQPAHAFGVDSLLAVELRAWIGRTFAADLPVFEIMGGASLAGIGSVIAGRSTLRKGGEV